MASMRTLLALCLIAAAVVSAQEDVPATPPPFVTLWTDVGCQSLLEFPAVKVFAHHDLPYYPISRRMSHDVVTPYLEIQRHGVQETEGVKFWKGKHTNREDLLAILDEVGLEPVAILEQLFGLSERGRELAGHYKHLNTDTAVRLNRAKSDAERDAILEDKERYLEKINVFGPIADEIDRARMTPMLPHRMTLAQRMLEKYEELVDEELLVAKAEVDEQQPLIERLRQEITEWEKKVQEEGKEWWDQHRHDEL